MLLEPISPLQVNVISLAVNHKNCGALGKKTDFLRTSQRGPQQPQQFQNRMNYSSQDAFQERMMNEMRRKQTRLDWFIRTHAIRNNRQDQQRVGSGRGARFVTSVVEWIR